MHKTKIRKKILNIRKNKNQKNIKFSFLEISKKIKKNNLKIIGGYYPVNFEINVLNFLKDLELKGRQISLPVIKKNNEMDYYLWSYKDLLKLNKFGIPEPEKNKKVIPDIILVPLVAFDRKLYRIGYGGGYLQPILGCKSRPAGPIPNLTLEPGMCMVVQPNIITKDQKAGVQTGEAVRITENGVVSLHDIPRGIHRIDPT